MKVGSLTAEAGADADGAAGAAEGVETPEGAGTAEDEDSVRSESGAAGLRTVVVAGPVTGLAASAAGIERSKARIRERMDLFMDVTCCVGKGLKQLLQHRNKAVRFP